MTGEFDIDNIMKHLENNGYRAIIIPKVEFGDKVRLKFTDIGYKGIVTKVGRSSLQVTTESGSVHELFYTNDFQMQWLLLGWE